MIIRTARPDDLPALLAIEGDVFGAAAWSEQQFADELERMAETRWYAVAQEDDGGLAGYAGLYLSPPDADVQTVAVSRELQGGGVGRHLLTAAVAHAWDAGCTRLFLEVRADNDPALALYRSAGFVRMGRRPRYYPDGTDAITMRLRKHEVPDLAEAVRGR